MNKLILTIILGAFLSLGAGCSSNKPKYKFPSDISSQCYGALNVSRDCINSKGVHSIKADDCEVVKVDGQRKFTKYWLWQYRGIWVSGLCYGKKIEIVCDPVTKAVDSLLLNHEFGHHWLMVSGYGGKHFPIYKGCFISWRDPDSGYYKQLSFEAFDEFALKSYVENVPDGQEFCIVGPDIVITGFSVQGDESVELLEDYE